MAASRSASAPSVSAGVVEPRPRDGVREQLLAAHLVGVAVRIVVALAAAELRGARVGGALQVRRRGLGAVLAHVLPRAAQGDARGVRLRGEREVDRALGQRVGRLGQPDVLDGVGRADRDLQRLGVGVADVLGGEDHHAPDDEARVLAGLEHHREVVQRGVRVRPAGGLDPGRDRVVVAVALLVVRQRAALERVLGALERDRLAVGRGLARELERRERGAGVTAGAAGEEREDVVADRMVAALAAVERPAQQHLDVGRRERAQLVDLRAGEQRGVDLEVRVLGRRPDERDEPLLDRGQERVLLGLVEAVDLVEEEDRRLAGALAAVVGALEHLADLGAPGLDGAELLERGARGRGDDPGDRRLPRAGRPVEDHRVRPPLLDRGAQRGAGAEHVLLADDLVERSRAHARGERPVLGRDGGAPARRLAGVEELVHHRVSMAADGDASPACAARVA